ncbi:enolase [Xylona heveae TC161]|uniref:Enolase n=1 Tax=Xylona heveae (strain CBS 132557 / TC161) TaxID=1328760 RepID=A0A165GBW0_XYLHT|nr:enolase [Xylona heveae TC161]KZF22001.1 enolase [Xylona heveae TC161]
MASRNIKAINAAQRLDSRGNPTVQVRVTTDDGVFQAIVPSGASKGDYEAVEVRDGDNASFGGKGVEKAVHNVEHVLGPAIINEKFDVAHDLAKIDSLMRHLDGTEDKSKLGANAILGISMACARAGAAAQGVPLYEFLRRESGTSSEYVMPVPFFNVLNGGVHSGNTMAFQEFMIAPVGAKSMAQAVRMGSEVYQELKKVIKQKFGSAAIGIGDEGGFAPPISEPHEALDLLEDAIGRCGYLGQFKYAIDPASSEFFNGKYYDLGFKSTKPHLYQPAELSNLYKALLDKYEIALLEDPFAQDDWQSWSSFCTHCPVELVGDDLLATNVNRLKIAHEKKACNSMLLKINQIGTITEALEAAKMSYHFGWSVFVSHRSGETTDDFIADLTVAIRAGHLKSGSPCRGERVAKYNRLMDIEDEIQANGTCTYAGEGFREAHRKG